MESPKTLGEKSGRLWSDLMIGATGFDDRARVAAEVERISRTQWTDYFAAQIAGPARRAILFYSLGTSHRDAPVAGVPGLRPFELAAFRQNLRYYHFDWTGEDAMSGETPNAVASALND
jgi:secreted Zn-dependent insulinase-like peptidase